MGLPLINIGFGNMAATGKIIAVIGPESAPIKRMVQEARERGTLIDATCGRKTRSILVMERGQLILSAVQSETISSRMNQKDCVTADTIEKE